MDQQVSNMSEEKKEEQQEISVEVTKRPKVLTDTGESSSQIVTVK
jgi:hypothetical protein